MSEEKPVLLRAISTNSNGSSAFSQEYNEFLKSEGAACMFDMNCFSSDDGAVSTDISATGKTPCLDDYPGKLDFRIELSDDIRGEAETVTSKVNCTYSDALDKIFIKKNVLCLLTFKVNRLSSGLQVRLLPVFESSEHLECSVVRCPFHQSQDVIAHRRHIIRCNSVGVAYDDDESSSRLSTVIPLQDNVTESSHFVSFACLSTCTGGINRRALKLCCTLERKQNVIGRRSIGLKISTCPGRERKNEERKMACENRGDSAQSLKRRPPNVSNHQMSVRAKIPKQFEDNNNEDLQPDSDGVYRIKIEVTDELLARHAYLQKALIENADNYHSTGGYFFANRPPRTVSTSTVRDESRTPTSVMDF